MFVKGDLLFAQLKKDWPKIRALLGARDKRRLAWLLVPMVVTALVNVFGIAFIMPFLAVVADPHSVLTNTHLNAVYQFFGFTHLNHFVLFLG